MKAKAFSFARAQRLRPVRRAKPDARVLMRTQAANVHAQHCTWHNYLMEDSPFEADARQLCPLWHHSDKESPLA